MTSTLDFQRARKPEQVEARRLAILATARRMLATRPVADISLRELSDEVGLAKSNVLRYFDSREGIFLEILDEEWKTWLDVVELELEASQPTSSSRPYAQESRTATVIADTLVHHELVCELISVMASVLEKNITIEFARDFKLRASANMARLATLVQTQLPHLTFETADQFSGAVFVVVAGHWPYANPSDAVAAVNKELGAPPAAVTFATNLREGLITQLIGLAVRASIE